MVELVIGLAVFAALFLLWVVLPHYFKKSSR